MRRIRPSAPMRFQPTPFLAQLASVCSCAEHQAEAQQALNDRRIHLLDELQAIDRAEVRLQHNIQDGIRRRGRLTTAIRRKRRETEGKAEAAL